MAPAVVFDRVSKRFALDLARPRSLQEIFVQRRVRGEARTFWALRDVSFSIEEGERVARPGGLGDGVPHEGMVRTRTRPRHRPEPHVNRR